jgi:hypothetical protein
VRTTWDIHTPVGTSGAVAIFQLSAQSASGMEAAMERLGLPHLAVGRIVRHTILGLDDGVVARWTPNCVHLMPHGGPAVVRRVAAALAGSGLPRHWGADDPMADYPEARSEVEARVLGALSRASSPRAIDLLLDQPRRWWNIPIDAPGVTDRALDRVRNRLLSPPLVVAIGPPNVGKSTLVNALAGRGVALTADAPGTTRDHVGVEIDLDGLVVHYVDTPGLGPGGEALGTIEGAAGLLARQVAARADLILACADASQPDPRGLVPTGALPQTVLALALRADRGRPGWAFDAIVGDLHLPGGGAGSPELEGLVTLISRTLVPPSALTDPQPWRFWD